jgi:DHA1 family bicyclomycin/chloramphenicol resistance-like MFS transporter
MVRLTTNLLLLLGALTAFGPLTVDMYLPSLPSLQRDYQADAATVQQTLSVFLFSLALGQALYGPVSDRMGRRPPLYFGLVLYIIASIGCAFAPTISSLIVLRFFQGLGCCAGMVIARAIVRDTTEGPALARNYSLLTLVMGVAPILAPLVGGYVLMWFGWHEIFYALAAFGAMCLVAVLVMLPETHPLDRRSSGGVRGALLVYWSLLRSRRYLGYVCAAGFGMSTMFVYITGSPHLFIQVFGVKASDFGLFFGINAFGFIAMSQLNRMFLRRHTADTVLRVALMVQAVSAISLLVVAAAGGGLYHLLLPLFLSISSLGIIGPNAIAGAMSGDPRQGGSASALLGTGNFIGGGVAGVVLGMLPENTAVSMTLVMAVCASSACLGYLLLARR